VEYLTPSGIVTFRKVAMDDADDLERMYPEVEFPAFPDEAAMVDYLLIYFFMPPI
jgi:hypothetical protein